MKGKKIDVGKLCPVLYQIVLAIGIPAQANRHKALLIQSSADCLKKSTLTEVRIIRQWGTITTRYAIVHMLVMKQDRVKTYTA